MASADERVLAKVSNSPSVTSTLARAIDVSDDEDYLFRLVTCSSAHELFLGIIEDVSIEYDPDALSDKGLRIRNLLCLRADGKPKSVRNVPPLNSSVYFASADELYRFFSRKESDGYLGYVRGTTFPLPLDLDKLCFGNTAVLAGINHGKSHLAAMLVSQLHLMKKKVLVVDPSGEWAVLINKIRKILEENAKKKLSISYHVIDELAPAQSYSAIEWKGGG